MPRPPKAARNAELYERTFVTGELSTPEAARQYRLSITRVGELLTNEHVRRTGSRKRPRVPARRPDNEERQAWMEHHYDQAVDAYATYESLASPLRWEAARYHFARGKVLGRLEMKQEAQSAYQQAFQQGFSEEAVKEALMELNR